MNWNSPKIPEFYKQYEKDWASITRDHTYEDEGKSLCTVSSTAAIVWEVAYAPIDRDTDGATMRTHYDTYQLSSPFSFVAKNGTTYTNVYYKSFETTYAKDNLSQIQRIKIVLIKYP